MQNEELQGLLADQKNIEAILLAKNSDDVPDFTFKPVTQGLGFHKPQSDKVVLPQRSRPVALQAKNREVAMKTKAATSAAMADLSAFYESPVTQTPAPTLSVGRRAAPETATVKRTQTTSSSEILDTVRTKQLAAGFIDLMIVTSFFGLSFLLFYGLSRETWATFSAMSFHGEMLVLFGGLFAFYFLCYFTFIDTMNSSSFGKDILGLRLVSTTQGKLTTNQTFFRACIGLLSVVALGLPLFLDFQGKLTDTKVVSR